MIVGYIGYHGYHQILSEDLNEPIPSACPYVFCPGGVYYPPGAPNANPKLSGSTTWVSAGIGNYNALTVDVNRHFTNGLQLRGVYTYSKNMDDGTAWNSSVGANAPGFVMYPSKPELDYGRSNTDVRNISVINGTYELPFGHGKPLLAKSESVGRRKLPVDGRSAESLLCSRAFPSHRSSVSIRRITAIAATRSGLR